MNRILTLCIIMLLIIVSADTQAGFDDNGNPNDPTVNIDANACYEGGTLEGRCNTDLEWIAGWYLIRYEVGIFGENDIPVWLLWILPEDPTEEIDIASINPTTNSNPQGCYTNGARSVDLRGDLNQLDNFRWFNSIDCTGFSDSAGIPPSSIDLSGHSMVTGADEASAIISCQNLLNSAYTNHVVYNWANAGYNTPITWWSCAAEDAVPL